MPRAARIAAVVVAVLLVLVGLYGAAGYWLLPRLLVSRVQALVRDELSLEARFQRVAFDPFDLRLEVEGFTMGPPGGEPAAVLEALRIDVEALGLLRRRVIVDELELSGPRLTLRVDEQGAVTLAGVPLAGNEEDEKGAEAAGSDAEEPQANAGEPEDEAGRPAEESGGADEGAGAGEGGGPEGRAGGGGAPIALEIRRLELTGGRFRLEDASRKPAFEREIGPIDLSASDLEITDLLGGPEGSHSPAELSMDLGEGAVLTARGDVDVEPLDLDLELRLQGLPLASLQPYASSFARVAVRDGVFDGQGKLTLGVGPGHPLAVRFQGSLSVSSLDVVQAKGEQPLLAWKRLDVSGVDLVSRPPAISVGKVSLAEPSLQVVQAPAGLNWARALEPEEDAGPTSPAATAPGASEAAPQPKVSVGPIEVSGGRVRFEDRSLDPAYRVELRDLSLAVDGFRNEPGSRSKLDLKTSLDGYAPLSVAGSLEPLAPQDFLDLRLQARGLELSSLSPYAGRFVGRRIDAGRGSATIEMRIDDHRLESENDFVLQGLGFGARVDSPEATSLPVAAAATLAADADGRITMAIPVAGNLDDPGFSYGTALFDAFQTLVRRVVATPFKIVGGMVSYGDRLFRPDEMTRIAFAPGDDDLSKEEGTKVDALAEALRANPGLRVDVRGGADSGLDEEEGNDLRVLARRRARAVSERLEADGVEAERIEVGDLLLGPDAVSDGRVVTRLGVR